MMSESPAVVVAPNGINMPAPTAQRCVNRVKALREKLSHLQSLEYDTTETEADLVRWTALLTDHKAGAEELLKFLADDTASETE